jgi:hypothetical protein
MVLENPAQATAASISRIPEFRRSLFIFCKRFELSVAVEWLEGFEFFEQASVCNLIPLNQTPCACPTLRLESPGKRKAMQEESL